eukprot:scaffold3265_cov81-Cylindrotheca_fusiformis.AAC.1
MTKLSLKCDQKRLNHIGKSQLGYIYYVPRSPEGCLRTEFSFVNIKDVAKSKNIRDDCFK